MKNLITVVCLVLAFTCSRAISSGQATGEQSIPRKFTEFAAQKIEGFLDFCNFTMIATGFITGCEKDPTIPNSNCYTYYPVLQDQVSMIVNELNYTLLIPTNLFKFIDDSATLINRYSLFQNYCQAATLLTKLDNVFQTIEGVTGLLYKVVLNYSNS